MGKKNKIKILLAEPRGFCGNERLGVIRAIELAKKASQEQKSGAYLLGEIVHNQHVVDYLEKNFNLKTVQYLEDVPKGSVVVIRAHGAPPEVYRKAEERGLRVVDATCPVVANIHSTVKRIVNDGKKILLVASNRDHDEILGIYGEAPESIDVVEVTDLDDITLKNEENTVVITQTTLAKNGVDNKLKRLKVRYPKIEIIPHVCAATSQRQEAVINLAKQVDCMIIVGSKTSSNTHRLKEVSKLVGCSTYMIEDESELNFAWLKGCNSVGISSGASTPDWITQQIVQTIEEYEEKEN